MADLDKSWHLSENEEESGITEFELQLWRLFWSFHDWIETCQYISGNIQLSGLEVAILHTARQNLKPKTLNDLSRILNRSDSHNIRYSIKKLLNLELMKKVKSTNGNNKNIAFSITDEGMKMTSDYAAVRKKSLIPLIAYHKEMGFTEMAEKFIRIKSLYEESERAAATYSKAEST